MYVMLIKSTTKCYMPIAIILNYFLNYKKKIKNIVKTAYILIIFTFVVDFSLYIKCLKSDSINRILFAIGNMQRFY